MRSFNLLSELLIKFVPVNVPVLVTFVPLNVNAALLVNDLLPSQYAILPELPEPVTGATYPNPYIVL